MKHNSIKKKKQGILLLVSLFCGFIIWMIPYFIFLVKVPLLYIALPLVLYNHYEEKKLFNLKKFVLYNFALTILIIIISIPR